MKIDDLVNEMAKPQYIHRRRKYYHGTSTEAAAKGIMDQGLQPQVYTDKRQLTPVSGRVYASGSLAYAMIYALGGDYAGSSPPPSVKDGKGDRHGYLFVVKGTELNDIQPDEDSVGEFVADILQWENKPLAQRDFKELTRFRNKDHKKTLTLILKDDQALSQLSRLASQLTTNQRSKIMDGEYAYFAQVGKKLVKMMSDELKLKLVKYGMHVANEGALIPSEVWKLDKARSEELKKDGSNFWEIAERIR